MTKKAIETKQKKTKSNKFKRNTNNNSGGDYNDDGAIMHGYNVHDT